MDSIVNRFEKHIDKSGECWLWTGFCDKDGYGRFRYEEKKWIAHRFSYYLATGEIPAPPFLVRHKCKSKNCVNPEHLESGTQSENCADRMRDGTEPKGEKNGGAKLTEAQVLEIRERSTENQNDLGKEFGVNPRTISYIIHRKKWAWLE